MGFAVKALKNGFPIPSDGNAPVFDGGLQHHLRDFAHHPTIVGLALYSLQNCLLLYGKFFSMTNTTLNSPAAYMSNIAAYYRYGKGLMALRAKKDIATGTEQKFGEMIKMAEESVEL